MSTAQPHPATAISKSPKAYKGLGMEGFIARWYAKNTGRNLDEVRKLAEMIHARLPEGASVLEVAPGPGYLAIELAKLGGCRLTGLDISRTFVEIATLNAKHAGAQVDFQQGDVSAMSWADNSFEFIVCRAAFKNFARPVEALDEMFRVLKPGGRALIIDLSKDASPEAIRAEVDGMKLGAVNATLTKLTFKHMLLKRAYRQEDFDRMACDSRFGSCQIRAEGIGLEILLTKPSA